MQRSSSLSVLALAAILLVPTAADARKPGRQPKTYMVGMAARSVSLDANGTFDGRPVYLGG